MMKPSLPQGTRDFNATVVRKRNYILNIIKNVFELYGFQPLETPAMENLETLTGKYGEEGDKLIFRILDSGNPFKIDFIKEFQNYLKQLNDILKYANTSQGILSEKEVEIPFWDLNPEVLESFSDQIFKNLDSKSYIPQIKNQISEKALRYDLTIPFARYVAMNYGQLTFPFKRYQIQPVWRADRPQRGRYREFCQCDADVVGSDSLINEAEFAGIYATVFEKLKIDIEIKINSRKILTALVALCGENVAATDIITAIDKLDKIGIEKVKQELAAKNLHDAQIKIIENYLNITGSNEEKLQQLTNLFENSEAGKKGIEEIRTLLHYLPMQTNIIVDPTLARGLDYYTGIIFEVKAKDIQMSSIGGGGRYDDLTGLFGVPNLPGAGISFGVDRIYDVMEEKKLFPADMHVAAKVLFFNLGEAEIKKAFEIAQQLRSEHIACEIYPKQVKLDKQFKYAEKSGINYVAIIGTKEIENNTCLIKNLASGKQEEIAQDAVKDFEFA